MLANSPEVECGREDATGGCGADASVVEAHLNGTRGGGGRLNNDRYGERGGGLHKYLVGGGNPRRIGACGLGSSRGSERCHRYSAGAKNHAVDGTHLVAA